MNESTQKTVEKVLKHARKGLLKKGMIKMKVFLVGKNGTPYAIVFHGVPYELEARDKLAEAVRLKAKEFGARSLVFVSDVWYDPEGKDSLSYWEHRRVSDDPNKGEAILALYEDVDGHSLPVLQPYTRGVGGRIKFGKIKVLRNPFGRFTGLLHEPSNPGLEIHHEARFVSPRAEPGEVKIRDEFSIEL